MDSIDKVINRAGMGPGGTSGKSQPSTPTPAKWSPLPSEPLCPECGTPADTGWMRLDVEPDHPQFGKPVKCPNDFHVSHRLKRMEQVSQLGPEDVKRKLGDLKSHETNRAMLQAASDIINRGHGWLYIWGGPGNAKSEVLKAIVNEMNESGRGLAMYTTLGRLLMYMRQAFSDGAKDGEMARFDKLVNVRVLAIDEMDKPKMTDWAQDFRFHFLDTRYISAVNKLTMTVFAGNPNPEDIFDEVIFDRFRDGRFQIVENKAASARPSMQW